MEVIEAKSLESVRLFLDHYHPMRCGGALRGKFVAFWGIEPEIPGMSFLAVFVYPRSRWKRLSGMGLELSRPDTIGSGVRLRRWLWIGKSGREEGRAIP